MNWGGIRNSIFASLTTKFPKMSKREKRIMGFGRNPRQINSKKRGTKSVVNHGTIHYAGTAILRLKMQEGKLFLTST